MPKEGTGFGTTAEQSIKSFGLCPMTAILAMAALNLAAIKASWSEEKDEGAQKVDFELEIRQHTNHRLPEAGSSWVTSEFKVGLESEFSNVHAVGEGKRG